MGLSDFLARHTGPSSAIPGRPAPVCLPDPVKAYTPSQFSAPETPNHQTPTPIEAPRSGPLECGDQKTTIGGDYQAPTGVEGGDLDRPRPSSAPAPSGSVDLISPQSLARLDDGAMWEHLVAVADRRAELLRIGSGNAPELAALIGQMNWIQSHRPRLFDRLMTETVSPGIGRAAVRVMLAADWLSELGSVELQDPSGKPIPWRQVAPTSRPVASSPDGIPTSGELMAAGWLADDAHRISHALVERIDEPFQLDPVTRVTNPEKWYRAIAADAMQGPRGPRSRYGVLMAEVMTVIEIKKGCASRDR